MPVSLYFNIIGFTSRIYIYFTFIWSKNFKVNWYLRISLTKFFHRRNCNLVKSTYKSGDQCFSEPECRQESQRYQISNSFSIPLLNQNHVQECRTIQQQRCEDREVPQQVDKDNLVSKPPKIDRIKVFIFEGPLPVHFHNE